jgi:hypothetical protein
VADPSSALHARAFGAGGTVVFRHYGSTVMTGTLGLTYSACGRLYQAGEQIADRGVGPLSSTVVVLSFTVGLGVGIHRNRSGRDTNCNNNREQLE